MERLPQSGQASLGRPPAAVVQSLSREPARRSLWEQPRKSEAQALEPCRSAVERRRRSERTCWFQGPLPQSAVLMSIATARWHLVVLLLATDQGRTAA